jgi:hypothetical protein
LVERLGHLVESGVEPSDVLVLTFSRNAVAELRRRLAKRPATRGLRVHTFDAWALDLLREVDGARDWRTTPFDQRIREATKAIKDSPAEARYETLAHVVIDEVQDLVGDRRELVQELLATYECGFTVVGDIAQSIYGFQVQDQALRATEAGRFARWLREEFGDELVERSLAINHRAQSDEVRVALPHGDRLRDGHVAGDARALWRRMTDELSAVFALGDPADGIALDYLRRPQPTAILCRTNGEALLVSEVLHAKGVPHTLRREAGDRVVPAWVADLLGPDAAHTITRQWFDEAMGGSEGNAVDPVDLWAALLRIAGNSGRRAMDVRRLRAALAAGRAPDELTAQPAADLVVSSIHRAKGLEFDRVLVVEPVTHDRDDLDRAEEARLLFVAMTRARHELLRLAPQRRWDVRWHEPTDRWVRYGRKKWERWGMEIVGGDVATDHPAGMTGFDADRVALQAHLRTTVRVGDSIVLGRAAEYSVEPGQSPLYFVIHDDRLIGVVSERFRRDLYRVLKVNRSWVPKYPRRVEGIRVDAIETVVGSEASGRIAGLGEHGVWCAPRLVGLGRFVYDKKEDNE